MQSMIIKKQRLGTTFTLIVTWTQTNRIHVAPIRLRLWMYIRITIHLTGRSLKNLTLRSASQSQHVVSTKYRSLSRLYRVCLIIYRWGRTCQIIDLVHLSPIWIDHIVAHHFEIRLTDQVPHVLLRAAVEVVETDYVVPLIHQSFT